MSRIARPLIAETKQRGTLRVEPVTVPAAQRAGPARWGIALMFAGAWLIAGSRVPELILGPAWPLWLGVSLAVVLIVLVPIWLWWWHRGTSLATIALAIAGVAATFLGNNPSTLGLLFVALVAVMLTFGINGAMVLVVIMACVQVALMVALGSPASQIALQTSLTLLVMIAGFGMALLVRGFDQAALRNRALLEELRSSVGAQKELVIADERSRAARDLHDGLGHRLASLSMSLEYAERMRERDSERAWQEVGQARIRAAESLQAMRTWVRALDPIRVGEAQGTAAFEAIADSFRGTGLEVEVHTECPEHELPKSLALFSYRFVQEGLTNVLKHGGARVRIVLDQREGLVLRVSDNGGSAHGEVVPGFGLRSLTERAEDLGGTVKAHANPDGFVLAATIPESS